MNPMLTLAAVAGLPLLCTVVALVVVGGYVCNGSAVLPPLPASPIPAYVGVLLHLGYGLHDGEPADGVARK
jgi:hypothetical protein